MIKFGDKQKEAIARSTHRWNVLIGATRSGKSHSQLHIIPRRIAEFSGIPGLRMLIAKTLGSVESNLLLPMREQYGERHISPMRIKNGLMTANLFGQEFVLMGGDNTRSMDKLRGKAVTYVAGDEAPTWPKELFEMLKTRMAKDHCRADLTGNPQGPYHWFKREFLDRAGDIDIMHLRFGLDDNPTLTESEKETLRSELTGVWYQRLILGIWAAAEGAIYDMFDEELHTISPAGIPPLRHYALGLDWGMDHPTAGALIGWNKKDELYQVSEYHYAHSGGMRRLTSSDIVRSVSDWLWGLQMIPRNSYYDPSALVLKTEMEAHNSLVSSGKTPGVTFNINQADNSVLDGINFIQKMFNTPNGFRISKVCKNSIRQHASYIWDAKVQQRGKDQPLKIDDDHPDAVRYVSYTEFGKPNLLDWKPTASAAPRSRKRAGYH